MPRSKRSARSHARRNPVGTVQVTAAGYGFVDTPEGEYFVPARKMGGAFDGDVVEVAPVSVNHDRPQLGKEHNSVGRNPTARVVRVVSRAHQTLVGRYEVAEPFGVVVPADSRIHHDIFTMHADNPQVHDGDIVRVRILQYPGPRQAATGVVEEVVGRAGQRNADIDALVAAFNLRTEFSPEVLADAGEAQVDADGALRNGYRDLRERCIFTIDPPDARDFDDALSLEACDGGWRLGVYIADVSHYVKPGSAVDAEARLRSTSVYLVDRVLPMLPEALSNGMCSLAPGEDRRCLAVEALLDSQGRLQDAVFFPALMRSCARLDYAQVQCFFDGDAQAVPAEVRGSLTDLRGIARMLAGHRRQAGALQLESAEARVRLDEQGHPTGVDIRRQTEATSLVEQCMVLANSLVAHELHRRREGALYRVHEAPDAGALASLVPLLQEFGYTRLVDAGRFAAGDPASLQQVLDLSRSRGESELVSLMLLRAMKRACYSSSCEPHYGLALDEYLHFTSPIRRYPDLVAHRALKRALGFEGRGKEAAGQALDALAVHTSSLERLADDAAAQSQQVKLVEYLGGFVGREFDATICRVASFGFFVRLDNTAEGLVSLNSPQGEAFRLDARRHTLTGEASGRRFRLGQRLRVKLEAAHPSARQLEFSLCDGD